MEGQRQYQHTDRMIVEEESGIMNMSMMAVSRLLIAHLLLQEHVLILGKERAQIENHQ